MRVLDGLSGPGDLRSLDDAQLLQLAAEIREFLVGSVFRTGGHLGPNLGVVELTIAMHRVFDSPLTPILFDTGHQAYVHKLLTGRQAGFSTLRSLGGLSAYPNRSESAHDVIENSHASTALSYADGLSKAFEMSQRGRTVVAVVGDGALTGGLAWEALNNLGASSRPVVVVLNDNGRSYAPTVGAMGRHLRSIRNRAGYTAVVERLGGTGAGGDPYLPSLFTELGFEYLGPVDGHDVPLLEAALVEAERRRRPVVVHCLTVKGRGYEPAERDEVDRMHAVGAQPGPAVPGAARARTWTGVFGEAMERIGAESENVVALSAAMVEPTGLRRFAERFPGRCFDVGIAEQHAVVSAAGLAMGGAHPVVALYATFAGRAFDQVLLDVGMHRLPVTFALDRAGITGPDGPSHHGIWDLAMLGGVPGMRVAAPRDGVSLVEELAEAVADDRGPTALRYPRSDLGADIEASRRIEGLDVLRGPGDGDVLIVAIGAMARAALDAADALAEDGVDVTVVDPRWVLPIGGSLVRFAAGYRHVVSVEDGVRTGGVGSRLGEALRGTGAEVTALGVPSRFVPQGGRGELLSSFGLDGPGIAAAVRALPGERSTRSAAYGLAAR
ncbi:MAG TPA: 1-deoxy-D-xylulose-5-phosphate synthase [Amnibacterium sp.]|nr:1-deoxy-D-xylulose-5-phosphate synthase [Amnibacterium sp.]